MRQSLTRDEKFILEMAIRISVEDGSIYGAHDNDNDNDNDNDDETDKLIDAVRLKLGLRPS